MTGSGDRNRKPHLAFQVNSQLTLRACPVEKQKPPNHLSVCVVEIRTEAVMQALALHNNKKPVVPLPSKRTSVQYPGQQHRPRERHGTLILSM